MPPKRSVPPPKTEHKSAKSDAVDEPPLQAVVLADSYNRRFEVLCLDQPRVLLPLCSTPLLTWTLESLSLSKVKQVFIFCGVHADKIREFVSTSPFRHILDIQCLSSQTARSAGDAIRELDAMQVLNGKTPFILVHSPLISNYDLSRMVEAHKRRRENDGNYIMTMGVGKGGRRHPESPILLVHPPSSRLLHIIPHALSPAQPVLTLPLNLFVDPDARPPLEDSYEIWSGTSSSSSFSRGGHRDLGVDVCEIDVAALCTENFDYHDLRRDFLNGVLTSELLGKKVAVHLVGGEGDLEVEDEDDEIQRDSRNKESGRFIDRVRDTRTFGEVSRDVLRRWAFPLVPDLNEPGGVQYELRKGNVYVAKDNVILSRTTILVGPSLVGPRTSISTSTQIVQSTLGPDCSIGPNTHITHSHLFTDVRIGSNCFLKECMIGDGVRISDDVKVGRGALIGDGVVLGKGAVVPDFARVGRMAYRDENQDSDEEEETDDEDDQGRASILGPDSVGYLWPNEEEQPSSDSDSDGEDPYEHPSNIKLLQLGRSLSNLSSASLAASTLSVASSSNTSLSSQHSTGSTSSLPAISNLALGMTGPPAAWHTEAQASLARAFDEDHSVTNALLEFRTLFMGYNAGIDRAREEVVSFLMGKVDLAHGPQGVLQSMSKIWERWGGLAEGLGRDGAQLALDVQAYCVKQKTHAGYFGIFLRALYELDLLDEEALVEWRSLSTAKGEGASDENEKKRWIEIYGKGKAYVDALEQAESEDEEDEESEEESD